MSALRLRRVVREARRILNLKIVTASAGTGKTYRLTTELDSAIASARATPDGIIATTFTTQAAAELIERARTRLLQSGHSNAAEQLLAARIGTVNSVCGALVTEFAFELGLSPAMRVLDDAAAEVEVRRALARVVSDELAEELDELGAHFEIERDWRREVREIIEAARANGIAADRFAMCAERSCTDLDRSLGPTTADDLDGLLTAVIADAIATITTNGDETKGTAVYIEKLRTCIRDLTSGRGLRWGMWAMLAKERPTKRSRPSGIAVGEIACRHVEHPRLRADMHRLVTLVFKVAAAGLDAYQMHKRARGVVDFVDQEGLALDLLRRPDIREALDGQIELVLVDEFQDTSPLQLALFLELAKLASESMWVGDPKQAIFSFRGTDPALMDAAVEALTSGAADPDLIAQAATTVGRHVESLKVSYRSRPALVALTSGIFARAFASQGIAEDMTRIVAKETNEPPDLGPFVEYWPLDLDRGEHTHNDHGRAAAVAIGVRNLFARKPMVRDGGDRRAARPADIAVLCRTNKQCQAVADALGSFGVPAIVPRMGLLSTVEGQLLRAGLALWVDPKDGLAAAELARIVDYPTDLDGFLARVLVAPGAEAFRDRPVIAKLLAAREASPDLAPVSAVEATVAATDLRALCAAWGDTTQRIANLDALRAHATTYTSEAGASGSAATLTGLLRHLDRLAPKFQRWDQARADKQAFLIGDDAVTILTWHRAKGLEWPITVLFGLESIREPSSFGVHVLSDREQFDVGDPLDGRWIRFWPNPYTTSNQLGAVRSAIEATSGHRKLVVKANREALRVLYVGWTRAKDRLIFAAERGRMLDGILGKLAEIDPTLISEPTNAGPATEQMHWGGASFSIEIVPCQPEQAIDPTCTPGHVPIGRLPVTYPLARATPSTAPAVPCILGEVVVLGQRIPVKGNPDTEAIGDALHAFFAADHFDLAFAERRAIAADVLVGHGVTDALDLEDLVVAGDRLWTWIALRFPDANVQREYPLAHRMSSGTIVEGTADLVVAHGGGFAVIDHKSFPGNTEQAATRAIAYSGQLAAYAAALRAATGHDVTSTWIHFPIRGCMVEVRVTSLDATSDVSTKDALQ
jgi:ATP-dependent helicase/nuclease subunit A